MTSVTLTSTIGGNSQTFTFTSAMIQNVNSSITSDIDESLLPQTGPMSAVGVDINGVGKTITIRGTLQSTASSVVTGTGAPTITAIEHMKYWLEGLQNGIQQPITFTSNYESYTLQTSAGSTTIDGVSIPGTWVATKVRIKNMTFDDNEASPDMAPFTMTLTVEGQ